jgi:type I restriction enzyme, S subunit
MNSPQRALSPRISAEAVQVKKIMTLKRRQIFPEAGVSYREIGIRSFGRGVFHKERVTGEEIGDKRVFSIEPGDLLFSNVFAWEGAVALAGVAESGMIGSHRFMTYVVNDALADARYLKHYFTSEAGLEIIRRASPGSAGRNRTLGIKTFDEQWLQLPDLPEQRRIAARLDTSFEKLSRAAILRDRSNSLRKAVFESAINAAMAQHVESTTIGSILALSRVPIEIDLEKKYQALGMRSFGKGIIRYEETVGSELSKLRYYRFPAGALVLSNIKAWEGAIGVTDIQDTACVASNRFLFYMPRDGRINISYLRHYLLGRSGLAQVAAASPGSADRNRTLSIKGFEAIKVPLPGRETQDRTANLIDTLNHTFSDRAIEATWRGTRATLLNAAFAGEL